jgi:hypothetical protein
VIFNNDMLDRWVFFSSIIVTDHIEVLLA